MTYTSNESRVHFRTPFGITFSYEGNRSVLKGAGDLCQYKNILEARTDSDTTLIDYLDHVENSQGYGCEEEVIGSHSTSPNDFVGRFEFPGLPHEQEGENVAFP